MGIGIQRDTGQSPGLPGLCHRTAGNNMQRMQLDTINAGLYHPLQGCKALPFPLSRQANNQVAAYLQPALASQPGGTLVAGEVVAAVNAVQGFIVGRLQTQLQPDLIPLLPVLTEQIQHRLRDAVRARPDAQPNNISLAHRLLVHRPQHLNLGPGTGIGLEIGQIAPGAVNPRRLVSQLLGDRVGLLGLIGKGGNVAEGAAPASNGAIAIRAAKAAVQGQLMHFFTVAAGKIATKHID